MTTADLIPPADAVDAAIARVLDAEHGAREAVTQAGDGRGRDDRGSARPPCGRCRSAPSDGSAACAPRSRRSATAEVAALDATAARDDRRAHALAADEMARVDAAVAALAALLTGSGA